MKVEDLTFDIVRDAHGVIAVDGSGRYEVIRKDLSLPKLYSRDTTAALQPGALEVEVPDLTPESCRAVARKLEELGFTAGMTKF